MIPILDRFENARRVLIAGCGGGFDVFAGVPLARHLIDRGRTVVFANLSFTNLWACGGERTTPIAWRVDRQSNELPYFPERLLGEWLSARGMAAPIYAFAKSGTRPLTAAYRSIMAQHDIDLVLLVDGGTDSLIFGDEPSLGSAVEDAISTTAAHAATDGHFILAAIGFGIDHHHGVSHHAFLENVAQLIREEGFLGCFALTRATPEANDFLDLVDYANRRQPYHRSIVCNSIASALRGEFGDYHATNRTSGQEQFINPLMTQYWSFAGAKVVQHMAYARALAGTDLIEEARSAIEREREALDIRPRRPLPL